MTDSGVKILFMSANPKGTVLVHARELTSIRTGLRVSEYGNGFEFDVWLTVTLQDMGNQIRRNTWDAVHFCGHGDADGAGILVVDEHDEAIVVPEIPLVEYFRTVREHHDPEMGERMVKLVVLHACRTYELADALRDCVPCVIGVSGEVLDTRALGFVETLYNGLGSGFSVRKAFDYATRQANLVSSSSNSLDLDCYHLAEQEEGISRKTFLVSRPRR